jgi:hypothetical protein
MIAARLYPARPSATVLIWSRQVDLSAKGEKASDLETLGTIETGGSRGDIHYEFSSTSNYVNGILNLFLVGVTIL